MESFSSQTMLSADTGKVTTGLAAVDAIGARHFQRSLLFLLFTYS
jgi:hypothetical protein